MPDPRTDLADIVEPALAAPAPPATGPALPLVLALAGILPVLAIGWFWHRRAPLRALRRLATESDPHAGAEQLARLMRGRDVPENWRRDLESLRFGPPAADAAATLARLCREAEALLQARR